MKINLNNYEAWFLDYHEGNLTPQQVADLLLFFQQHPELKKVFENFENITLEDYSAIEFENKSSLKKPLNIEVNKTSEINAKNYETYFISGVENTLSSNEKDLLNIFIKQHPRYLHELELFQKTKLQVDLSTVFENKEALKHTNRMSTSLYYIAVAASILLLVGLFFLFNNGNEEKIATNTGIPEIEKSNRNEGYSTNLKRKKTVARTNNSIEQKFVSNTLNKPGKPASKKKEKQETIVENKEKSTLDFENLIAKNTTQTIKKNEEVINKDTVQTATIHLDAKEKIDNKQSAIAQSEIKKNIPVTNNYLSLREIAITKIKEKTLDEQTLDAEEKNGRLKKFTGWDFAQLLAKGLSQLTRRNVEVKPKYNEQGDITAYALALGEFQISRTK